MGIFILTVETIYTPFGRQRTPRCTSLFLSIFARALMLFQDIESIIRGKPIESFIALLRERGVEEDKLEAIVKELKAPAPPLPPTAHPCGNGIVLEASIGLGLGDPKPASGGNYQAFVAGHSLCR